MLRRHLAVFLFLLPLVAVTVVGCSQKKSHWGQTFDIEDDWWKREGQSWDRESNIFMTIGYSNPAWKTKYDMRKSADLDARAQVASFMRSLVKNYMEEIRGHRYAVSESLVRQAADETVIGAVIVARKYKGGRNRRYRSLIKVDLDYFFDDIYAEMAEKVADRVRKRAGALGEEELDRRIHSQIDKALADIEPLEIPTVEKTVEETKGEVTDANDR